MSDNRQDPLISDDSIKSRNQRKKCGGSLLEGSSGSRTVAGGLEGVLDPGTPLIDLPDQLLALLPEIGVIPDHLRLHALLDDLLGVVQTLDHQFERVAPQLGRVHRPAADPEDDGARPAADEGALHLGR